MQNPPIDSSSEEGITGTEKSASISFEDVNFYYPSRPDIQVPIHIAYTCVHLNF